MRAVLGVMPETATTDRGFRSSHTYIDRVVTRRAKNAATSTEVDTSAAYREAHETSHGRSALSARRKTPRAGSGGSSTRSAAYQRMRAAIAAALPLTSAHLPANDVASRSGPETS